MERCEIEKNWLKVFGTELPKYVHKAYAEKYLKWQNENNSLDRSIQKQIDRLVENFEKGISENITQTLVKMEIKPGTKLIRDYKGKKYEVIRTEKGYEYSGKFYKSLSAIANLITGTRWNGKRFFGLV